MMHMPSVHEDSHYWGKLVDIETPETIPALWKDTPIEQAIMAQNFHWPIASSDGKPKLLVATCIDFRIALAIPRMYSYVIRSAGGRLIGSELPVAYTLAKGVRHMALIGHNDCGMTKVFEAGPHLAAALIEQGWKQNLAEDFVKRNADRYAIDDELEALQKEYNRLRALFKNLMIAPLFVSVSDNKFCIPKWYMDSLVSGKEPAIGKPASDELLKAL